MTLSLQLYRVARSAYSPREFNNVYMTVVYVAPSANVNVAGEKLQNCVNTWENKNANGATMIPGDFNKLVFEGCIHTSK